MSLLDTPVDPIELAQQRVGDRYTIESVLPCGGLVWYFRARRDDEPVVLALLPLDAATAPDAEAGLGDLVAVLAGIDSPYVLRPARHGLAGGMPFLEYPPLEGDPLEGRLAGGPLASLDALKVAGDTLRALQAIHDEGLVHGDITPSNLLVHDDADGVAGATLLGSGIDSFVRRHCQDVMPGPVGSGPDVEAYWAPERLRGGAPSVAADIYAVGVLLHRLVTGELPRGSISPEAFADIPGLPDIVRCATQDDPHARYRNAEAMLAALDWLDVVSAKMSPHTQDIPLWMETSMVGSIPVTALGTAPEVVALPGKPPSQKPPAPPTPPLPRRPPPGQPPPIPPEAVIRGATPTWPGVRSTQTPTGGVTRGAQPTGATRPTQPAQPTVIVRRSRSQRTLLLLVALLSIVILGLLALLLSRQGPRSGGLFDPQPVHRVASGDTPG